MAIDPSNQGYDLNSAGTMGISLDTFGVSVFTTEGIDGHALSTRGLVWGIYAIFLDIIGLDPVSTSWINTEPVITTNWISSEQPITTVWTTPSGGIWGNL